jgi:O-antigen/teichoic acid export membrane protein
LLGVVGIVINGILGLVLIPQMGLLGAGLAKTLSLCAQFVPAFIIFQRESRLGFAQTLAVRREDWMDIRDRVRNFLSSL